MRFLKKPIKQNSYTLIEMLLVVSILSMVSLILFHTLCSGLNIWERSRKFIVEEDIAIFFDKIGQDLRNSFIFSKISFVGKETLVRFPTRIKIARPQDKEVLEQIGEVEYYFGPDKKSLFRRQLSYGQALNHDGTEQALRGDAGKERLLLSSVESVRFVYYFLEGNGAILKKETDAARPRGVTVEVEFLDGRRKRSLRKLINLPQEATTNDQAEKK